MADPLARILLPLLDGPATVHHPDLGGPDPRRRITDALLVLLAGPDHPAHDRATTLVGAAARHPLLGEVARLAAVAVPRARAEFLGRHAADPTFARTVDALASWLEHRDASPDPWTRAERVWSVTFPQGVGLRADPDAAARRLRRRRVVAITEAARPLADPSREVLLTANALLTVPTASMLARGLDLPGELAEAVCRVVEEPQLHWYDHPVPLGVDPAADEVVYGLRHLDAALAVEARRGRISAPVPIVLSVSTTHAGLRPLARAYLEDRIGRIGGLSRLTVHALTETDAGRLVDEVLEPAARLAGAPGTVDDLRRVAGVEGPYGRHYSLLKAIASLWAAAVDPAVLATFKIDLDQLFPQDLLLAETGKTAFDGFVSSRWGARGVDAWGEPVDLGMVAGSLVDEKDVGGGLRVPDVRFPHEPPGSAETVFWSRLPQAVSTLAEVVAVHDGSVDGVSRCLERIHVTGGTTGITVDALRRHRPFTPTFVGRAEDQAYPLSALHGAAGRLGAVHEPGLVMRHDKASFASEAIEAARAGKLVGDMERMLVFTGYARAIAGDAEGLERLRARLDPFTGAFVSDLPVTVTLLRFALTAPELDGDDLDRFLAGAGRLRRALRWLDPENLAGELERERRGWDRYHEAVAQLATEPSLRGRARELLLATRVG